MCEHKTIYVGPKAQVFKFKFLWFKMPVVYLQITICNSIETRFTAINLDLEINGNASKIDKMIRPC